MSTLANLRKNKGNFAKLIAEIEKKNQSFQDDRFWNLKSDKTGSGRAVIRFLPDVKGDGVHWVSLHKHSFEINGRWFIENCPTSIGKECPVCENNNEHWNAGDDLNKEVARKRKRKLYYFSNILVVDDPANPENNGKVFLFRYGVKIFEKIEDAIKPEIPSRKPVNPFDFDNGSNFHLVVKKVEGYPNYDKSEFESERTAIADSDEEISSILEQCHSLSEIVAESEFKSYDELKKLFDRTLSGGHVKASTTNGKQNSQSTEQKLSQRIVEETGDDDSNDQSGLDYFKKLDAELNDI